MVTENNISSLYLDIKCVYLYACLKCVTILRTIMNIIYNQFKFSHLRSVAMLYCFEAQTCSCLYA